MGGEKDHGRAHHRDGDEAATPIADSVGRNCRRRRRQRRRLPWFSEQLLTRPKPRDPIHDRRGARSLLKIRIDEL
jgi:hypothetical protein